MTGKFTNHLAAITLAAVAIALTAASPAAAQNQKNLKPTTSRATSPPDSARDPDAQGTKRDFDRLLNRYPPTVRGVFREDPNLMLQPQYVAKYPALEAFLTDHPEVPLNPAFYLGGLGDRSGYQPESREDARANRLIGVWDNFLRAMMVALGFAMAIGLLTWLIRTFLDYRRWNRLSKVQAEVHARLLDRFSTNEEVLAYIATPAGSKFLQSAPISLDMGTSSRSMGAPLSRIMWSLQAGLVLVATGCGLMLASGRMGEDSYLPFEVMGIIAVALGVGFAVSAAISFVLSHRMGLLDPPQKRSTISPPEAQ